MKAQLYRWFRQRRAWFHPIPLLGVMFVGIVRVYRDGFGTPIRQFPPENQRWGRGAVKDCQARTWGRHDADNWAAVTRFWTNTFRRHEHRRKTAH